MDYSHVGANPNTANRILDVICKRVDSKGVWDAVSLVGSIADATGFSKRTVSQYLRALRSMGLIAYTKIKPPRLSGGMKVDRVKLLKPGYVVIKEGGFLDIAKE